MRDREKTSNRLSRLKKLFRRNSSEGEARPRCVKTLYVHIGTHKTGTSSLQLFLSRNRQQLKNLGIIFPECGSTLEGAHHYIANALKGPPFPMIKPERSPEEYLEDLRAEFLHSSAVLLSSEIFMRLLPAFRPRWTADLSSLERLSTVADRVCPIVYLRPQEQYLESFYRQAVLDQVKATPAEFQHHYYLNYLDVCQQLEQAFGQDSAIVRVYDKKQFAGGTLFSDFLSIFGVQLNDDFVSVDIEANPSFVADAIEFRRLLNCLEPGLHEARRFNPVLRRYSEMQRRESSIQHDEIRFFDTQLRASIRDKSTDINARVSHYYIRTAQLPSTELPILKSGVDKHAYGGLGHEALETLLEFIGADSPELLQELAGIAEDSDMKHPEASAFVQMLRTKLHF